MEINTNKDGWPEEFKILSWGEVYPKITKCVRFIFRMPHQFSEQSDHKFDHPLDEVFDKPPYSQDALFNAELSGWGTDVGE